MEKEKQERNFGLGTILSVTSGYMLVDTFDKISECISYLAGDDVPTVSLPRLTNELRPLIYERYPELQKYSKNLNIKGEEAAFAYVAKVEEELGYDSVTLPQMGDKVNHRYPIQDIIDIKRN